MAFSYLPPAGVRTELVEFDNGPRRVHGAVFHPAQQASRPDTVVILIHGVEQFW